MPVNCQMYFFLAPASLTDCDSQSSLTTIAKGRGHFQNGGDLFLQKTDNFDFPILQMEEHHVNTIWSETMNMTVG